MKILRAQLIEFSEPPAVLFLCPFATSVEEKSSFRVLFRQYISKVNAIFSIKKEADTMELPKHTTQVGTIPTNKKLYIEDYCISYRKQLDDMYPGERKQIALFGTLQKDKNIEYAFAYGAVLLGRGKGRTDSLTPTQREEAETYREKYFPDYQMLGLIIETDSVNEAFYWLGTGTKSIAIDGYYIFYDQNEIMLNFMMENQNEERAIDMDPVIVKKADMDRERREKKEKEEREKMQASQSAGTYRKRVQSAERTSEKRKGISFPMAAGFVLVAILCVYGVRTYYPNITLADIKTTVSNWVDKLNMQTDNYLPANTTEVLLAESDNSIATDTNKLGSDAEISISSELPPSPADLDIVVIPDLDTLTGTETASEETSISTEQETPDVITTEQPEPSDEVVSGEVEEKIPVEYLIKRGDNLLRILRAHYGDESKLQEICVVNNIKDPNNIQVGQTILLP